jgi:two-component system, NtrC family, nitrogen regulation sensor histidine kinase NtrY
VILKLYNKYQPWMSSFSHYSIILLILALISSFLTYGQITQSQISNVHNPKVTIILIMIDLVLFLVLSILVTRKIFRLWHKGKHQSGRLQNKIILMFCLVAAIPTIIVTVFSTIFFNFGIQSWFDQRVSTAINESVVVAESYFKVQIKLIESDAKIMAQELNYVSSDITYGPERFANYLTKQAEDKTLVEASIFQVKPDNLLAESRYNFTIPFHNLPKNGIEEAINDKIVLIKPDDDNKLRALIKLDFLPNSYLLIGRTIDNKVLDHMANTKGAASEYERLRGQISNLQIQFLIIFIVVSLLLLFTAIWLGLTLSSTLIKPLNRLVSATTQITKGNFSVILDVKNKNDEISVLANAFNTMTSELGSQRTKLIKANHEIQAKHHFNETVLSGVSTGIVALDMNLQISMINPTALNILSLETEADLTHQDFNLLCPEISILLPHAQDFIGHEVQKEIVINRGNRTSILVVRIITEKFLGKTEGYIITFDDITALVLAQRSAAWSDVARKVAHEIKNPLTPIHLATERLRKKYSQEVSDTQNFEKYLEIIGKHVKDIGTIVEEFVQFARMPAPEFAHNNLVQIVRESIFSRKCLDKDINYITEFQVDTAIINCDPRQISQVLLNLLKNAEEAIEHCHNINRGEIKVLLLVQDEMVELEVMDNGGGFSSELFDHLTEPYVTNKSTGTGLGLAIVKKVLDDHKTAISFTNNNTPGATIKLTFNLVK